MSKSKQTEADEPKQVNVSLTPKSLSQLLTKKPVFQAVHFWIVGDTPLIVHAWSEKAKREMLSKQLKSTKAGREIRDPQADFVSSLYDMGEGRYGFPVTGIKNCILSAAHKDKGIPRSTVMSSLFLEAEMTRVGPALAGAICDMPLVPIYGSKPEMREDMVKVGSGLNKTANLAYRGQFTHWAFHVKGKINLEVFTEESLIFLIQQSGMSAGLGEWRNERKGVFGAFHLASADEEAAWDAFRDGKGPVPVGENYKLAAE